LRATFLVVISMGISLGGSIPGIVGVTLMPHYGWPVIFIVGGIVPLVVGLLMIVAVPESIKFLVLRGGREETVRRLVQRIDPDVAVPPGTRFVLDAGEGSAKTRASIAGLFRGGWAVVTVLVWLIFVLNLMANNLLNAWLPMIVQSGGHSAEQGAYAGTLYQLGGSFGGLLIGISIDRIGLKVLAVVFAIAVPVVALTGTAGLSVAVLLVMAFLSGCVVTGMQNALNASAGLIYPTSLRGNGVGYALGVGRVGSVAGPLLGSLLSRMEMPASAFFYVTAIGPLCCAVFSLLLLRAMSRERRPELVTA
jgi:AAHS family 4-hydroxybenzoate transporter-like MFS transporter